MNAEEADELGIEDMASLESAMPGLAEAVKTFFTVYKVPFLYLLWLFYKKYGWHGRHFSGFTRFY